MATATLTAPRTIVVRAPATGETLGEIPVATPEDVRSAVAAARAAQKEWGELKVKERCRKLKLFRTALADRLQEVVDLLVKEGGKTPTDAFTEASGIFLAASYFL